MKRLRIGWVGCGTHANEMLLPQLTRFEVKLAALCDTDEGRLSATAERFGVAKENTARDWRDLLARSDLDAVGVAAGPAAHAETGLAAVGKGLPVFIEKPPAATAAEAQKLADAAKARGVPVVVGFMKRYSTANRIAANVVRSDEFGQPISFLVVGSHHHVEGSLRPIVSRRRQRTLLATPWKSLSALATAIRRASRNAS